VILAEILHDIGRLYHDQCNIEIDNGAKVDRGKCSAAKALFEEALVIRRDLKRNRTAAETLMLIASLYSNLEMYDEVRCSLKEALDLTRRCLGKERPDLVDYHQRKAFICQKQACELREQVNIHKEYLLTNSMSFYHSPGSRVRVAGLQNKLEYNGLQGIVVKEDALRLVVRLDRHNDKELKLKPENAQPLIPTLAKLKEQFQKIQDLQQEQIASSKEAHCIQLKAHGVKHINNAITCRALGAAYSNTFRPIEAGEAVALLIKADRIRLRVGDEDTDTALDFSMCLQNLKAELARFDEVGVLSAMPCCWPCSSRQDDEKQMAMLFAGLQVRDGKKGSPSMSTDMMQQGLRLYGLFNVTVLTSDPVSCP